MQYLAWTIMGSIVVFWINEAVIAVGHFAPKLRVAPVINSVKVVILAPSVMDAINPSSSATITEY
jgi:hypothetical protein